MPTVSLFKSWAMRDLQEWPLIYFYLYWEKSKIEEQAGAYSKPCQTSTQPKTVNYFLKSLRVRYLPLLESVHRCSKGQVIWTLFSQTLAVFLSSMNEYLVFLSEWGEYCQGIGVELGPSSFQILEELLFFALNRIIWQCKCLLRQLTLSRKSYDDDDDDDELFLWYGWPTKGV